MYTIEQFRSDSIAYRENYPGRPRLVGALSFRTEIPAVGLDQEIYEIIGKTGLSITPTALRTVIFEINPETIRDFDHLMELCRLAEVNIHIATFRRGALKTGAERLSESS